MKKKFLSFLVIALVCCSAMFMFAGCEGDTMSNVTASFTGGTLSFTVQEYDNIYNKSIKEQVKLATNLNSISLTLEGATFEGGSTSTPLNTAIEDQNCTVSGLKDLTTPGSGTLIVFYQNFEFDVPYEVKAA